jgi:hypothetical protein
MTTKMRGGLSKAMRDGAFGGRSDVYRWLRKNFTKVSQGMAEHQPSWDVVAVQMAREAVMGARGKPPNGHSVRRVWQRVRRDVEEEEAARAAEPKVRSSYASRMPATWRPTPVIERSGQGAQQRGSAGPGNPGPADGTPARPRTTEEKLAKVRRDLAERSGR